jgi:formylglycine-generating enzyme required for sulfatase activity
MIMAHLDSILKWSRHRDVAQSAGAATRGSNRAKESAPSDLRQAVSWPETFVNPTDGSTMRLIPGGVFTMGSTEQDIENARKMDQDGPDFALHETPQFELFVPSFYISVFTVTNEQFGRFLSEMQPSPALFDLWVYSTAHILKPDGESRGYRVDRGFERHSAVHVTFFGAEAYCRWAKLRLPTEVEWEKAARGTDARLFPWGNEWHDDFLRWHRNSRPESEPTTPVDAYPEGRSPYGIFQMVGNVAEWCADWYQPNAYTEHALGNRRPPSSGDKRVLRGGTCVQWHKLKFRCAMRQASTPAFTNLDFTGIRCACDLPVFAS